MSVSDYVVLGLAAVAVIGAFWRLIRQKKRGGGCVGCSGGCPCCSEKEKKK